MTTVQSFALMSSIVSPHVAGLDVLRGEWAEIQDLCWAVNTHKARRSQWRRYDAFCSEFGLTPLPASPETVCLHVTYLSRTCCYVTIKNYYFRAVGPARLLGR